jgi:hypothetical protein
VDALAEDSMAEGYRALRLDLPGATAGAGWAVAHDFIFPEPGAAQKEL